MGKNFCCCYVAHVELIEAHFLKGSSFLTKQPLSDSGLYVCL